jgi:hypothetical protein
MTVFLSLFDAIIETGGFLPFLQQVSPTHLGLFNNTLYEVLDDLGVGTVNVTAITFDVSCGVLPNITGHSKDQIIMQSTKWALDGLPVGNISITTMRTSTLLASLAPCAIKLTKSIRRTNVENRL